MAKPLRIELFRPADEPHLTIGDIVQVVDGVSGTVVAWYIPPNRTNEVCYLVEPEIDKSLE
jgi:hypothetical protein